MQEVKGDIWNYYDKGNWIVIPTNGTVKANGEAVMGRGLALRAKLKFPQLPFALGRFINAYGNVVFVSNLQGKGFKAIRLITFPVKNHWKETASLHLIERSCNQLVYVAPQNFPIYLPRVGCGNGRLDWEDVKPILERYLDDRFIVVY